MLVYKYMINGSLDAYVYSSKSTYVIGIIQMCNTIGCEGEQGFETTYLLEMMKW